MFAKPSASRAVIVASITLAVGAFAVPPALAGSDVRPTGLTVERGSGELRVKLEGTMVGRIASGRIVLRGHDRDGAPLDPPANCQPIPDDDRSPIGPDGTIRCQGQQLRLGLFGADFRLSVSGRGINLSIVGNGTVSLKGRGTALRVGDKPTPWTSKWQTFRLGAGVSSTLRSASEIANDGAANTTAHASNAGVDPVVGDDITGASGTLLELVLTALGF